MTFVRNILGNYRNVNTADLIGVSKGVVRRDNVDSERWWVFINFDADESRVGSYPNEDEARDAARHLAENSDSGLTEVPKPSDEDDDEDE
jgi:hypothetical protein